jgi:hypothetical protein
MVMLEHLRIAKHHLEPAFPPKYNIFQYCFSLFHSQVRTILTGLRFIFI